MNRISIIVPCYNEESTIPIFYSVLKKELEQDSDGFLHEIIFVNDGSSDNSLNIMKSLAKLDDRVKFISFSRNFGKESAIIAGMAYSKGEYVAIIDVDLQDPPQLLIEMYDILINSNYDCVGTRRKNRLGEPKIRSSFSDYFYTLFNRLSNIHIVNGARDYRMMTRQMADAILKLKEYNRFSKGIFSWVGFNTTYLDYENIERVSGQTKWSFWKLFLYSLEGITSFSTLPLMLSSIAGIALFILSIFFIIAIVIRTILFGDPVAGWPSTISIILLLGGMQLLSNGIMGQYIGKIYLETKNRPIYIVKETNIVD